MKPTFKIFPRVRSIKQNGEVPVYIRVTINRRSRLLSLNLSFPFPDLLKHWDPNKCCLVPPDGDPLWLEKISRKYWDEKECRIKSYVNVNPLRLKQVNQELEKINTRARTTIHQYNISDKPLTLDEFESECMNPAINGNNLSFYDFAEKEIAYMKQTKSPSETIRTFSSLISKLKKYRDPLYFEDITLDFLRVYHGHMINKMQNMENTCSKTFRFMRNMINRAILQKIISDNIFDKFTIKSEPGKRESLSEKELKDLEDMLVKGTSKKYLDNVLKYFLFTCYTGLRYRDLKELRFVDLKKVMENGIETTMISILMHKTKELVSIPIIPQAYALIGEIGFMNQKIFRVSVNQVTNRHLKEITKQAKIEKKITFHSARHTFAIHCLNSDIPMELIRDLLGHSDIKTTKIYAKYTDNTKIQCMRKWK